MGTAREELHESMCGSCCGRYAAGECEAVDRQINAYAHELAEKIRRHPGQLYTRAATADLIDPEVNQ